MFGYCGTCVTRLLRILIKLLLLLTNVIALVIRLLPVLVTVIKLGAEVIVATVIIVTVLVELHDPVVVTRDMPGAAPVTGEAASREATKRDPNKSRICLVWAKVRSIMSTHATM